VPQLTPAEWDLLREGLQGPDTGTTPEISNNMATLTLSRPVTCPMLDLAAGTCPVYAKRRWRAAPTVSTRSATKGFIASTSKPRGTMHMGRRGVGNHDAN